MISTDKYTLELIEPKIIKITIPENMEIELDDVMEMKKGCTQIANGNKFCILLDATKNFSVSSPAREKLSSKEYADERVASALVIKSLASKLIGNFFINFNKPADPTKLFSDEMIALLWLREQIKKSEAK